MKKILATLVPFLLLIGITACSPASNDTTASKQSTEKTTQTVTPSASKKASEGSAPAVPTTKPSDDQAAAQPATPEPAPTPVNQVAVTLVSTTDGDTIKVNENGKIETVRYLLVDTPEEKKPNTCVQPYSMDAAQRNDAILRSGNITLEFEEKNKVDKYGRLLAYVFVNGKSVQETLLQEGYARVAYIYYPPYKYLSHYQTDESIAKNKELHIWSKPGLVTDNGFIGCADGSASAQTPAPAPKVAQEPAASSGTELFANCTELRKKYPNGVPKGHPAYQDKMDRDKDGYACEK
jgi:micrococcal nuclease